VVDWRQPPQPGGDEHPALTAGRQASQAAKAQATSTTLNLSPTLAATSTLGVFAVEPLDEVGGAEPWSDLGEGWSVGLNAKSLSAFSTATAFAVHILREDQAALSQRFAASGVNKFSGLKTQSGLKGVPLLPDCAARLECLPYAKYPAGDHILFIAEVQRLASDPDAMPLVYHGGRYAELADKPVSPV